MRTQEDTGRRDEAQIRPTKHACARAEESPFLPADLAAKERGKRDHVEERWTTSDDLLLPGEHVDHEHVGDDEDKESGSG